MFDTSKLIDFSCQKSILFQLLFFSSIVFYTMQHHLFFDHLETKREARYPRQQELNYNSTTQVGNWFEERQKYKKNNYKHLSTYSTHFTPKPFDQVTNDLIWSEKFKSEGIDPIVHSKYGCLDYPNFFENFSTTYDLSFNHYPQWYKNLGHIERKLRFRTGQYEPLDDYINSFNNITRQGLLEEKKEEWCQDKWRTFNPRKTHNQEVYKPPFLNDYKFPRHAPPRGNSSKLYPPNMNAQQILRNGVPSYVIVPHLDMVQVLHQPRNNTSRWERTLIDNHMKQ